MNFVLPLLSSADVSAQYLAGTLVNPQFAIDISADVALPSQHMNAVLQFGTATMSYLDPNFDNDLWEAAVASAGVRAAIRVAYNKKVTTLIGKPVKVQLAGWTDASLVSALRTQLNAVAPNVLTEVFWQYPEGNSFVRGDSVTLYLTVPFAAGTAANQRTVSYDPRFTVTRPTLQTPAVDVVVALRVVVA